ncbi:MAG TPA: hypothetical protein VLV78_08720 [Thermoanaerobaculia bacterium]|nr:hypothetical protein [Thermoanaerobaculia bacterium]
MLLVLTALAFLLLGRELSLRWWRDLPFYEFWTYAGAIGVCLWLASVWIAALLHVMTVPVMVGRTFLVFVVAVWLTFTRRFAPPPSAGRERALLAFVLLWIVFILWRGWLLPPVSHDALAYHLPKAVFYARAAGFEPLSFLDPRISTIPANYEMLLADAIVLQQRDRETEWISTLFYALFVLASAAMAERWWKSNATGVALLAAGIPVALLHSGAHKNDLMTAFFMVAALVASGRFISERDQRALLLAAASFAAAIGTKPQAAALAICVAPAILWRAKPRQIAIAAAFSIAAFLILGGAVYVSNYMHPRGSEQQVIRYGDWSNLWQGPYVLLAAPFAPHANELPVPWADHPWFWRRYEVFFSHLGIPFALCAIATPFAMFALRKRAPVEAFAVTGAAFVAFLIMLPVNFQPHGMYAISLPRYALFIVPIVFAWAVPQTRVSVAQVIAIVALLAYGVDTARNDAFAPWGYVQFVRAHPDTRQVPFDPYRAAEVADRRAGPNDRIALDAAFGTWIHPAFGAELSRPVDLIPAGDGPPLIRDDADWVVVDRQWNILWQHPEFRDLSQARSFLVRGKPSEADTRVLRYLRADSRFRLVFYNPAWNQAVFQRIR